jgi:hypothetical protein
MRSKPAYWQGAQKITDWTCRGYSNLFYDGGSGLKTTPVGGQQKGGRNHIATLSVFRKRKALGYTTKNSWILIPRHMHKMATEHTGNDHRGGIKGNAAICTRAMRYR